MIKIIKDEKSGISSNRIISMEMNIAEISRFLIHRENVFVRNIILRDKISEKEMRIFSEINWKIATEDISILLKYHRRLNPFSKVISHYEKLDEKTGIIKYNPKKFLLLEDFEKIGNITHEAGHHFGFSHSFYWNPKRKYSGVYLIGYIYEFLSFKMYEKPLMPLEKMDIHSLTTEWNNLITKEIY